jgi:hypothetical protein
MWISSRSAALAILPLLLFAGCGLISLETLEVESWPSDRDSILQAGARPWVEFPAEPNRPAVGRLLSVSSGDGQVSGDLAWDGDRLYFTPEPPLKPGVRYVLGYHGLVTLADGRSFQADVDVPFFSVHAGLGPLFSYSAPADGGIATTATPLVLGFARKVDAGSFAREFSLQPSDEIRYSWSADGTVVTISPESSWQNLATYSWSIGKELEAADGTPSGVAESGRFRVQADSIAPAVLSVQPATRDTFAALAPTLDDIRAYDAILLTFSEDLKTDTLSSSFSLDPAVKGAIVRISPGLFAYSPQERFLMSQRYVLKIASSVEDLSGNKLAQQYSSAFTPLIPVQSIVSIQATCDGSTVSWTGAEIAAHPEKVVDVSIDGEASLAIEFALPFTSAEARARMPIAISLEGYFPNSTADPALITAQWIPSATLVLTYDGLVRSDAAIRRYYKLLIPGGSGSPDNGEGSYLEGDAWLMLRTQ